MTTSHLLQIYGVLSLCDDGRGIKPDYSPENSKNSVYRDFFLHHLTQGSDLAALGWCILDRESTNQSLLPSWIPDWSKPKFHFSSDKWHASRDTSPIVRTSFDPDVLYLMGLDLDVVESFTTGTETGKYGDLFGFIINSLERYKMYPTGVSFFQAVARTLIFDQCSDSGSSWTREDFTRYVTTLVVYCFTHLAGGLEGLNEARAEEAVRRFISAIDLRDGANSDEVSGTCFGTTGDWHLQEWWPEINQEVLEQYDDTLGLEHLFNATGSRMFCTKSRYLGLCFGSLEIGDHICVLHGCPFPVILRRVNSHYVLVGHCFVLGLMQGQAIDALNRGDLHVQELEIH